MHISDGALRPEVLTRVEELVGGEPFLELAGDRRLPDFRVATAETGEITLLDPSGELLAPLGPAPEAERIVQALVHLAKVRNLRELANPDTRSPLRGRLRR